MLGRLLPVSLGGGRRRRLIQQDLDLYERLPEDSSARQVLLEHIERSVAQLTTDDTTKRRDPFGMTLAGLFLLGGGLLIYVGWNARSWAWVWWISGVVCLLLGAGGMAQDGIKAGRDERGRRVSSGA